MQIFYELCNLLCITEGHNPLLQILRPEPSPEIKVHGSFPLEKEYGSVLFFKTLKGEDHEPFSLHSNQ